MLTACWERKVGVCTCEAGAPISQADLERHPVGLRKRALPLHKSCLVFRCCGIKEKQIVISLAGPEVWRDLQLGISVPKADVCPHATLATAISEMCKKGVGEGRPQPETMLPRSGRNTDLHCCGKHTAPTGQQMQSLQYKLLFVFYLEGSTWRHTCRITTTAGDVDSSPALWYPQPILSQVTHARIISLLCCKDNRTATPDWGCPFLLFTHRHIALMLRNSPLTM